jgi:hypothetical protein
MLVFLLRWQTKDTSEDRFFQLQVIPRQKIIYLNQRKLTELEGSVQLTSTFR